MFEPSADIASAAPRGGFEPGYVALFRSGELAERARLARERLSDCDLCARYCHVDRTTGMEGAVCRTGEKAVVSSFAPHHGEEAPLSGRRGSGTIFFSWCNLRCLYCQNWDISWQGHGIEVGPDELAGMMLALQDRGCHNINFVSPSHVVAQIIEALVPAAAAGLRLPLVYNTGGYDSPEALALLDGIVDIYMPDAKYADPEVARKYSKVRDYVVVNQAALKEMHRQVGDLSVDDYGIARRGVLLRHLVLPDGLAGTREVLRFVAEALSPRTYINIMAQYRPCYRAGEFPELGRRPSAVEVREAVAAAKGLGLQRLDDRSAVPWV